MNLEARLTEARILCAATLENPESSVPFARALELAGLQIMEVPLRRELALEYVRRIADEVPGMSVGVGTLLRPEQITAAIAAGAKFGVTPGFNPKVIRFALNAGFPLVAGVYTPGEMEQALELGCRVIKWFPAEAGGGIRFLNSITGPYFHTGLRIIPFGGIGPSNLATYLAHPLVAAVGGSWLADAKLIATANWSEIGFRVRQSLAAAKAAARSRPSNSI